MDGLKRVWRRVVLGIAKSEIGDGEDMGGIFVRGEGAGGTRRRFVDVADRNRETLRRGEDTVGGVYGDGVGVPRTGLEMDFSGIGERPPPGARSVLDGAARSD